MNCMFFSEKGEFSDEDFMQKMRECCGSQAWCQAMRARRPILDQAQLKSQAEDAFDQLSASDWLEAFSCHPKIGDVDSLRMKFAGNEKWSHGEQSGVSTANDNVIERLAKGNKDYEERFGFIFIVCATGKSAEEMLCLLEDRIGNERDHELTVAASEQRKITHLRIDKLIAEIQASRMNQ